MPEKNLNCYSKDDLKNAFLVINSLLSKCEKSQLKTVKKPSQNTLLLNRIKALRIASELIQKELKPEDEER